MTDTMAEPEVLVTVRARQAAYAWLNAFLASSTDEARPALYKTIGLEWHDAGVQMIGCDGTVLFRTWTPTEDGPWPDVAEAPRRSVVVMDPDGFGIGFMRSLLRVTSDKEHEHEQLTISTSPNDEGATIALGTEFMTERLSLRACGQRIDLLLYDGHYPDWRRVRLGMEAIERMASMTVATRIFGLVGRLKAVDSCDVEFYGDKNHIAFVARGESEVRGLLMPMKKPTKPVAE